MRVPGMAMSDSRPHQPKEWIDLVDNSGTRVRLDVLVTHNTECIGVLVSKVCEQWDVTLALKALAKHLREDLTVLGRVLVQDAGQEKDKGVPESITAHMISRETALTQGKTWPGSTWLQSSCL